MEDAVNPTLQTINPVSVNQSMLKLIVQLEDADHRQHVTNVMATHLAVRAVLENVFVSLTQAHALTVVV